MLLFRKKQAGAAGVFGGNEDNDESIDIFG
jgi:hypothetical protein